MNIYTKLTLLSLFLVIINSAVLLFFIYRNITRSFKDEIIATVEFETGEQLKGISDFFESRQNDLKLIETAIRHTNTNQYDRNVFLEEFTKSSIKWHSVGIISRNEEIINNSGKFPYTESTGLLQNILRQSIYFDFKNNLITFSHNVNNESMIYLVGVVPINVFDEILTDNDLRTDLVLTSDGKVILGTQKEAVLTEILNNWEELKARLATDKMSISLELDENLLFASTLNRGQFAGLGLNWILISSRKASGAYSAISDLKNRIIWIIIPVLIGVIILALIMANYFVSPIIKLSQSASEIGKGNFSSPIEISSKDEIGQLARELNNTSKILISRIEQQNELNKQLEIQKNEIMKQKDVIEESNYQIKDSISYARRIQRSMLPDLDVYTRLIGDVFVFFQPKDIVSGDFYWFERVRKGRNDYLVIACADCTGHGVPGAIMSIMGSNQLTNIVYYQNYLDPKKILARLDKNIKFELYRDEEEMKNSFKDGMEIGLAVINLDDLTMEYAGVGIPLYHFDGKDLHVYKPIKEMAGGFEETEERDVENKIIKETINLKAGDRIFMATDGFQDQFGGNEDKKFMVKNFRNLLINSSKLDNQAQYEQVKNEFFAWRGESTQTDDVLVLGIQI